MKSEDRRAPPEWELEFFGTITASISHELANVISTLHQGAGLLKDMIETAERGGYPTDLQHLKTLHKRLSHQTERGSELIQEFNRFSHTIDDRHLRFDIDSILKTLVSVSRRFAELKGIQLDVTYSEKSIQICTDPYAFIYAVFLGLERAFETTEANDTVELVIQQSAKGARVLITGPDDMKAENCEARLNLLNFIVASLPGELLLRSELGFKTLEINIPGGPGKNSEP